MDIYYYEGILKKKNPSMNQISLLDVKEFIYITISI